VSAAEQRAVTQHPPEVQQPRMRKYFTHSDAVVPVHHPRALVEAAASLGVARDALLENVGITLGTLSSPEARISYRQFAILAGNALRLTANPALGFDYGLRFGMPQLGPLGLAIMSSATVGAALDAGMRYSHGVLPAWEFRLEIADEKAHLTAHEMLSMEPFRVFAIESVLAALASIARSLLGAQLPLRQLRLPYPRPEHADRYRTLHDGPILFDQDVIEIVFDASLLALPLPFADPATATLAERFVVEQLGPLVSEGLLGQVRKLLDAARGPLPNLDQLARTLQTSPRTLRRALHDMGTSYQELLEASRRLRAVEWVSATGMTFDDIAKRLGFSDVRSFRRAFKRWTGHTPGDHRRETHAVPLSQPGCR
jgi:AraC-like DNA-binding protein